MTSLDQGNGLEPIAIVGMSCRLSGDVSTLSDFWTQLSRSRDGWCPIPADRYASEAFYHPNPQKRGCSNSQGGYFIKQDLQNFDAPFFQITAQEAVAMDPQQRILLECTYEALENAGISKGSIAGRKFGVFVGGSKPEYENGSDVHDMPIFGITGSHQSIQAGRISYYFDLRGPCISVDTACSSSLHAVHLAVQSLRSGESEAAIVAGCTLHPYPDNTISMSMLGLLNDQGKTFAFDHRAKSGFARGEGGGALVLKRLPDAIRDNDHIYSVIVGSGVNNDGRTAGITSPSIDAQEQLIRDVYKTANISPDDAGFVEAHGTGTKVGDPIEAEAIFRVFGPSRSKRFPLYVGSAKTNFGHLENASGIVSIIKSSLMLDNGFILPNVNFEKANESIPLEKWNLKVPTSTRPWPSSKRFVSINNFGFGGSNAHIVLEAHSQRRVLLGGDSVEPYPKLLVLSGNDEAAVKRVMSHMQVYLGNTYDAFQSRLIGNMAYSLGERRTHLPWRVAIVASTFDEFSFSLNQSGASPTRSPSGAQKIAFVYTGQGAQWAKMGEELMASHPIFRKTIKAASSYLQRLGAEFSLEHELCKGKEDSNLAKAQISQPACTAVQLALTNLLASWGIAPLSVTGHSSGEIAAAYATGAVGFEDAMAIAYHRGRVAATLNASATNPLGAMLAIGAGASEAAEVIKGLGLENVSIACENSPSSVTASGNVCDVDYLAAELGKRELFHRKLHVDIAYHSSHMQVVADDYFRSIRDIKVTRNHTASIYSSLIGRKVEDMAFFDPSYWVNNLTKPVLFNDALKELYRHEQPDIIIEIGPHSALKGPIRQVLQSVSATCASDVTYLPTLVRNQAATATALSLAARLFLKGQKINFIEVNQTNAGPKKPALINDLAPYPWSWKKYWSESRSSKQRRLKPFPRGDLLGLLDDSYNKIAPTWRNIITLDDVPWLRGHRMQSSTTFPLAGYLCMAVEACSQRAQLRGVKIAQISGFRVREVHVSKAMILDEDHQYETLVTFKPYPEGTRSYSDEWDEFSISSCASGKDWIEHCRGLIGIQNGLVINPINGSKSKAVVSQLAKSNMMVGSEIPMDDFYSELRENGLEYSYPFILQSDCNLRVEGYNAIATATVPDTSTSMPFQHEAPSILSPAFLDTFLHLIFVVLGAGRGRLPALYMPTSINEGFISSKLPNVPGGRAQVLVHGRPDLDNPAPTGMFIDVCDTDHEESFLTFHEVLVTPVRESVLESNSTPRSLCYKIDWETLTKRTESGEHGSPAEPISGVDSCLTYQNGRKNLDLFDDEIVIISEHPSGHIVSELSGLLKLLVGGTCAITSLTSLTPSSSVRYICLLEMEKPVLDNMSEEVFQRIQALISTCNSILWVMSGAYLTAERPHNNIIQGLLRSVRSETGKMAATLDLDPKSQLTARDHAQLIKQALISSLEKPTRDNSPIDSEYAEKGGELVVQRIMESKSMNSSIFHQIRPSVPYLQEFSHPNRQLELAMGTVGALDTLYWRDEKQPDLAPDEIEIQVFATGMNFKDVVIAMGQVASPYIGVECSGIVSKVGTNVTSLQVGARVCAMTPGAYSTYARCPATSARQIPDGLDFESAASIPVVFCTAYYAIFTLARIEPGEKILIHAAAGGVGQAAIQLAQMAGAEIFATVGSIEKKILLQTTYGIPGDRIFYSRNTTFGPLVREASGGTGVDVVINSLAGDLLRESWNCLAPFGRFIEIGKRDIVSNTRLEMSNFDENCAFHSVDLTKVAGQKPKMMGQVMGSVFNLLEKKIIRPITPIEIVSLSELEGAFRKLQSGKTNGKVVVSHVGSNQVMMTHTPHFNKEGIKGYASYVIIGGTGGLGISITKRLIRRGARSIVLISRTGTFSRVLSELIESSKISGASIHIRKCDVGDTSEVEALAAWMKRTLPPVAGVIHAAMVLDDVLFENMTFEQYQNVVRSKISGSWNFHSAFSDTKLDFFIMLSSLSAIIGNRGQAAYSAANSFLDALVRHRRRKGLAATSLNLTAVMGIGYLKHNAHRQSQVINSLAGNTMDESEVLALVDAAIDGQVDDLCDGQCIVGLNIESPDELPYYTSDAKFTRLCEAALANASKNGSLQGAVKLSVGQELQQADSLDAALKAVIVALREKIAAILMIPTDVLSSERRNATITELGFDSLNAIELRNWISRELQCHMQILGLLASSGLEGLASTIIAKTKIRGSWIGQDERGNP